MGSAAFAAGGAAAAGATGVSVGGYTLGTSGFVSGAISGAVGSAISSPLRQTGNMLAGWQDDFSFKEWGAEIAGGVLIGGTISGLVGLKQSGNFWWGNSVKNLPGGEIGAGIERVVNSKTISNFANDNNIYGSQKGKLSSKIVNDYYEQMVNNTFDPMLKANRIGGYTYNGKYIIGEGHHRVAAAIKYGMKTGNHNMLINMMNNGSFSTPTFNPTSFTFPKYWQ